MRQGADRVPTEGAAPQRQRGASKAPMRQARQGAYNPLPDLLRLERGRGSPIGSACDHISVMLRRDSDFGPVAAAFKCALCTICLSAYVGPALEILLVLVMSQSACHCPPPITTLGITC